MSKRQDMIEKRRRERDNKKKAAKLAAELQESLEVMDDLDFNEPVVEKKEVKEVPWSDEPEVVEKMDGMPMSDTPRPTSWPELDAARDMAEKAHELRELGWDVQDLVYNILNTNLSPSEKAGAIKDVGSGFQGRVEMILSDQPMMEDKEIDLEVLALEALQSHDNRNRSFGESVADWLEKKKLTAKRENALSDEQFAVVYEEDGKTVRKYPIHDKAHVRNALARAAQMIQAGGKAAEDAKKALPKIRTAAKKMGIEVSTKKERNSILVEKDASGQWRWVGWVSNNFVDTDGDIFAESAHQEYVEWLNKNMEVAPLFLTWHTPDTAREKPVDFAMYESGFTIMSGPLTEGEAEALLKARKETEIGMSHGALVLERDKDDPRVILKYRTYEVSDLALSNAANPFTALETICKEVDMDKKEYLATILGKERAEKILAATGKVQKELQELGIEHKETDPVVPEAPPVPEAELIEKIKAELHIDDLSAWVTKANEALEKVEVLETAVKELSKSADDKLAEKIAPPVTSLPWMQALRKSQDDETEVEESDELSKAVPKVGWLSEATGTQPIPVE